jgi:metal iron transporter
MNQNPNSLAPALTTRQDLNGIVNSRVLKRMPSIGQVIPDEPDDGSSDPKRPPFETQNSLSRESRSAESAASAGAGEGRWRGIRVSGECFTRLRRVAITFSKFVGPGFMVCSPKQSKRAIHN